MADILIEAAAQDVFSLTAQRAGVFWTSPTVGYVIYVNSVNDLKYRKTVNGGANWAAAVNIRTGAIVCYDCWADWQTAGDAGTKIHIAYMDSDSDDIRYVYLDTAIDTVGGDDQIEASQKADLDLAPSRTDLQMSITKTRGGNLAVAFRYVAGPAPVEWFYMFYTSPDATTWTSKPSPWEAALDYIQLFPGNEADNQDVWAVFWDLDATEISLKTYDDSGNSWSEQLIAVNMTPQTTAFEQMGGQVRLSDGHLIFAAWSQYNNPASDLMTWDINGAGSIVAKTNILTDTPNYILASVFINQVNDDIYVAYIGGTAIATEVAAHYQKSVNGGANWGGQQAMQADAEDDERWISAGCMKAAWGGKFQPVWFNDDDNDLFTNSDNGISIAAKAAVGLENKSANMGSKMVAAGLI